MSNPKIQTHNHPTYVSEVVQVKEEQLPLVCPSGESWNMHPRVYLQFDQHHQAQCPYCGTRYFFTLNPQG